MGKRIVTTIKWNAGYNCENEIYKLHKSNQLRVHIKPNSEYFILEPSVLQKNVLNSCGICTENVWRLYLSMQDS